MALVALARCTLHSAHWFIPCASRAAGCRVINTHSTRALCATVGVRIAKTPVESVYRHLPSFEAAVEKFDGLDIEQRETILKDSRNILLRHALEPFIGIDIKHKHFDIPPDHWLVEQRQVDGGSSIMSPKPSVDLPTNTTPCSFVLIGDTWVPYEFVIDSEAAQQGLAAVTSAPDFLSELARLVSHYGVQDILGFNLLHRDHLGGADKGVIETPGQHEFELLLRPYSDSLAMELDGEPSHQVMWSWNQSPRIMRKPNILPGLDVPSCKPGVCIGHPSFCAWHPQVCAYHCRAHCKRHKEIPA